MNFIRPLPLLLAILFFGCQQEQQLSPDHTYASAPDTIRLSLSKVPGTGPFSYGYAQWPFYDTTELSYPPLVFPDDIQDLKISLINTDSKPYALQAYRNGKIDERNPIVPLVLDALVNGKIDTAGLLPLTSYYIYLISGRKNGETVFVVDQNSNRDLTDDPVRIMGDLKPQSSDNLIKCIYPIYNDREFVMDSAWIKLGTTEQGAVAVGEAFHHSATLSIGAITYELGVTPSEYGGFAFTGRPILARVTMDNRDVAKPLTVDQRIHLKEYLPLGTDYYQFHDISNDGRLLTLVKEPHFDRQTGLQPGLLAPDFTCITVDGQLIDHETIGDSPLLITNLTACGSGTLKDYQAIMAVAAGKIQVLAMEPHPGKDRPGLIVDTEDERNRLFHQTYRKDYSSRVCYLIGPDGRILEKFNIHKWEDYLPQYLVP